MAGDQDAALSAVGSTELVHGLYRAQHQKCVFAANPSCTNYRQT
jgi:hypothetical protein